MSAEAKRQDFYKQRSIFSAERNECEKMQKIMAFWKPRKPCDNKKKNLFYEEFKPFWICFKLAGLLPYRVTKNGDIICKFLSKEMLYSVLFYALISIPIYKILYFRVKLILQIQENFDDILFTITMTSLMIPHTVVPYSHWFQMKTFQFICKSWKEFQEKYEKITGCAPVFNFRWKMCIFLPCIFQYIFVVFCVHFFGLDLAKNYISILAHVYIVTGFFLHNIVFVGQSCLIIYIARNLKRKLKKVIENEQYDDIPNWTHLWFHLSKLVRYVGLLFNKMYLHLILTLFCLSTLATYRIIKAISAGKITTVLLNTVICFHVGKMWLYIFTECGERVTYEVGNKFIEELTDLKIAIKTLPGKENVQDFINTINQFPPVINFHGFVDVNRKLLKSLMVTSATYLFVVFQFSLTTPYDCSSFVNSTNCSKIE